MRRAQLLLLAALAAAPFLCAQQSPSAQSDAVNAAPPYRPPTHSEAFHAYVSRTYGFGSILEAGVRAGIDQARLQPSQWPEGAQGYAERYGSAMGEIVVRRTTEYALGEIFREDLRLLPCRSNCSGSKFEAALEDTFTARKGSDGHRAFSVARIIGPIAGSLVAETWKPGDNARGQTAKGIGLTFGLVFVRNLALEFVRRRNLCR